MKCVRARSRADATKLNAKKQWKMKIHFRMPDAVKLVADVYYLFMILCIILFESAHAIFITLLFISFLAIYLLTKIHERINVFVPIEHIFKSRCDIIRMHFLLMFFRVDKIFHKIFLV